MVQGAAAVGKASPHSQEHPQRQQPRTAATLSARAVADTRSRDSAERNPPRRPISERLQRPEELQNTLKPRDTARVQSKGDAVMASSPSRKARSDLASKGDSDDEAGKTHRHKKQKKHRRN